LYETTERGENIDFSTFLSYTKELLGCFVDIEEADESIGEGLDEIGDASSTGYGEVLPDDSDMFRFYAGFLFCLFKDVSMPTEGLKGVYVSKIHILELHWAHVRYAIDTPDSWL
jgi:hypothetical protein